MCARYTSTIVACVASSRIAKTKQLPDRISTDFEVLRVPIFVLQQVQPQRDNIHFSENIGAEIDEVASLSLLVCRIHDQHE